jgi:hypothetical protein
MERVLMAVTNANYTASATCINVLGQWKVTVTWIEPNTSKDEIMARYLQKKEFDGRGGAVCGGHVDGGTGCGDHCAISASLTLAREMWQQQTDYEVALKLQAHFDGGRDCASAGSGRNGASAVCGSAVIGSGVHSHRGSAGHHGGAVRAGGHSHRGSVGHHGGAMWNCIQFQKNTQEEADYKLALQLLAEDDGCGDGSGGHRGSAGHHGGSGGHDSASGSGGVMTIEQLRRLEF